MQNLRPAKVLIRSVNWLGDAVMSTPALLRLREAYPNARIAICAPENLAELWQNHPAVDRVISFGPSEGPWSLAQRLRKEAFQLGVVLPNSTRSALELWLARIPERVGYAGQWRSWTLTRPISARPGAMPMRKRSVREIRSRLRHNSASTDPPSSVGAHHLHHYLYLVSCLGACAEPLAPRLVVAENEVQEFLRRWNIESPMARPLFGLSPGAEYGPAKRWPAERFVLAAVEIQQRTQCRWVIFGGPGDAELAERIATEIQHGLQRKCAISDLKCEISPVLNLAGRTTLRELCAGLKACRVLLTNDSGPMHVAAAVGTRVVALFGSTSAALTGPGLPGDPRHHILSAKVPCAPCFLRECPIDFRCMHGISERDVVEAVMSCHEDYNFHEM